MTPRRTFFLVFLSSVLTIVLIYSMTPRLLPRHWDPDGVTKRRRETEHVDCGRVLRGDKNYTLQFTGDSRIPLHPQEHVDMSCFAIQSRIIPFGFHLKPLKIGVAFARIVYRDYEFLEKQVQMSYHSQNHFCFGVDGKSSDDFKWKMWRLGRCLPNLIVMDDDLTIDSAGHNMNLAHYRCMEQLVSVPGWEYLVLMQNHDVIGKTVYELSRIFELLGGANDIEIDKDFGRTDKKFRWDLDSLQLFRDDSKNHPDKKLQIFKGSVQGSISRRAVQWMVWKVDPLTFIDQWNQGNYGVDEQWLATFQANEFLKMPGGFTGKCVNETGKRIDFVSRWSKWSFSDEKDKKCASGTVRHGVCILGIEDLRIVASMPNLMFNKMMPSFDYSIVECTAQLLFNRTFLGQTDNPLDEDYYLNMVNVIHHKHHHESGYELNCAPGYKTWNLRKYPL